jgi:hypothetical protein
MQLEVALDLFGRQRRRKQPSLNSDHDILFKTCMGREMSSRYPVFKRRDIPQASVRKVNGRWMLYKRMVPKVRRSLLLRILELSWFGRNRCEDIMLKIVVLSECGRCVVRFTITAWPLIRGGQHDPEMRGVLTRLSARKPYHHNQSFYSDARATFRPMRSLRVLPRLQRFPHRFYPRREGCRGIESESHSREGPATPQSHA